MLDPKITDRLPLPEAPALRRVCAQLIVNRGTFELGVNASGARASSDFMPADRDLEIRHVRAALRGTGLWAGDLGISVSGDIGWCGMRRVGDTIVWTAAADCPLYADRGSRITLSPIATAARTGGR